MRFEANFEKSKIITYTRSQALADRALIPVENYLFDTTGQWQKGDETNEFSNLKSLTDSSEISAAIKTSLETSASPQILEAALKKFDELQVIQPNNKCLIVAKSIDAAQKIYELVKGMDRKVEIATSMDSKKAHVATNTFKYGSSDILVTCQMCYEGLDCRQISVVCLLTHIRSKPWIEQAIARGTRFDPLGKPDQKCHLFTLQDQKMERVLDRIRSEDVMAAREMEDSEGYTCRVRDYHEVMPLQSGIQDIKWSDLDTGKDLSAEIIKDSVKDITGLDVTMAQASEISMMLSADPGIRVRRPTPYEINKATREKITRVVLTKSRELQTKPEEINRYLKKQFGNKGRAEMTNQELQRVLQVAQAL